MAAFRTALPSNLIHKAVWVYWQHAYLSSALPYPALTCSLQGTRQNLTMQVSDVTPAKDATGRNNSLMLSTPTGRVLYVADSETEQVEWLSAIEGAVQKIVRQVCEGHFFGSKGVKLYDYLVQRSI